MKTIYMHDAKTNLSRVVEDVSGTGEIYLICRDGKVLLDRAVWRLADDLVGDTGLGDALERHGAAIDELPCDGENPDIDPPADLRGLGGFP